MTACPPQAERRGRPATWPDLTEASDDQRREAISADADRRTAEPARLPRNPLPRPRRRPPGPAPRPHPRPGGRRGPRQRGVPAARGGAGRGPCAPRRPGVALSRRFEPGHQSRAPDERRDASDAWTARPRSSRPPRRTRPSRTSETICCAMRSPRSPAATGRSWSSPRRATARRRSPGSSAAPGRPPEPACAGRAAASGPDWSSPA